MPEKFRLSDPQQFIVESGSKINLFMGGTGSGKTFVEGVLSANFVYEFPQVTGFIGANTYEQLNTSTMKGVRDVWKRYYGMAEEVHYVVGKRPPNYFNTERHNYDRYDSIISINNGAVIYMASLDNYKAHEGKEIGWAILDETKDTKEEAVKEVILHRLRQKGMSYNGEPINPLYIGTSPAKVDWINEWFHLDEFESDIVTHIFSEDDFFKLEQDNKCIVICSTFHNKANLPPGHISDLIKEHENREGKLSQAGKRLIYADPFVKVGGEFYSSFERMTHVKPTPYVPEHPIHISFDFNVVPYLTLTCYQIIEKEGIYHIRAFDEFCLESPNNSTELTTLAFRKKYESVLKYGLYYYGDPSGASRDTRGRKNDFQYIEEVLWEWLNNYSKRVSKRAPPIVSRRDFVNKVLDERFPIRFQIDQKCRKLIADFEYVKEDIDGKKLKVRIKDSDTGQTYEKYGHTSDSFDYFITQAFKEYFRK